MKLARNRSILSSILLITISMTGMAQQPLRLQISHIAGNSYVFTTWNTYKDTKVPANGMYIVTEDGAILIDNPWDTTQFQPLLDSIAARHKKKVIASVSTHFHEDRVAAVDFLNARSIPTYAGMKTVELCRRAGRNIPTHVLNDDQVLMIANHRIDIFYPGAGHSGDNIVVYLPDDKILFGGCFIKSLESTDLGNLSDANLGEWPASIARVKTRFPSPAFVIPGHGSWEDKSGLEHTLKLLQAHKP